MRIAPAFWRRSQQAATSYAIVIHRPDANHYWITTTYARERRFRKWWLQTHQALPLIEAYEQLALKYPRGLAEVPPLPVELSGEMQEAISQ